MTILTVQFNYVKDYVVLFREDFIKYVGTILPREISRDHINDVIVRCKRTVSDFSKGSDDIRPLLNDLLDNIAVTKLPNGRCDFCDTGWGLYKNGKAVALATVNDEGNIAIKSPGFVKFFLSFDSQDEDFSIDDVLEMCKVDIKAFVNAHQENFPLDNDYVGVSFGIPREGQRL